MKENVKLQQKVETKLFGVSFSEIVKVFGGPPKFILEALDYLQQNCLFTEGLFRVAGTLSKVDALKSIIENGLDVIWEDYDAAVICTLVKTWFSSLTCSIVPLEALEVWIRAGEEGWKEEVSISAIKESLSLFSLDEKVLLQRILFLCTRIVIEEEKNKMNSYNLAVVLAQTICFGPEKDKNPNPARLIKEVGFLNTVFSKIIENYGSLFGV